MFNCSSNLFRFSLAVNGGAAATACGERLRLEMGTAFRTGKEASVGLRTQCSQGLFLEICLEPLPPVQCLPVSGTGSEMTGPPFLF